jgi:hypothetical protein
MCKSGHTSTSNGHKANLAAWPDTIPNIQPALNHTTIGRLAQSVNNYEFVVHPGDFAYADDWIETPSDWIHPEEAVSAHPPLSFLIIGIFSSHLL